MNTQGGWRFCDACFMIFFAGEYDPNGDVTKGPNKGVCPARSDGHHAQGFVFYLPFNEPNTVGQLGWRFCKKCHGMFFIGNPGEARLNSGKCPKDHGLHDDSGSFEFTLPFDSPSVGQPDWAFCKNCCALFFNASPRGKCAANGGPHDGTGSFNFDLPHHLFPSPAVEFGFTGSLQSIPVISNGFEPNGEVVVALSWTSGGMPPQRFPTSADGKILNVGEPGELIVNAASAQGELELYAFDTLSGEAVLAPALPL